MITELMQDIITRAKQAPLLQGRAGAAAGGKPGDPTMRKVDKLPFAWLVYIGNQATAQNRLPTTTVTHEVVIKVVVPYTKEADLFNVSYPALEEVISVVTSTPVDFIKGGCTRWSYLGTTLEELDDRLVYEQRYAIAGNL